MIVIYTQVYLPLLALSMKALNQSINSTVMNNTIFVTQPLSTLESTRFITTFGINETEYLAIWNVLVDYEMYGWNILC